MGKIDKIDALGKDKLHLASNILNYIELGVNFFKFIAIILIISSPLIMLWTERSDATGIRILFTGGIIMIIMFYLHKSIDIVKEEISISIENNKKDEEE